MIYNKNGIRYRIGKKSNESNREQIANPFDWIMKNPTKNHMEIEMYAKQPKKKGEKITQRIK